MRILFFGDIVGEAGRRAFCENADRLRRSFSADICVANGENVSGGFGLTGEHAGQLVRAGADVITMGNHVWTRKEIVKVLDDFPVIRPYNLPAGDPGEGILRVEAANGETLAVVNLIGRLFMDTVAGSPFDALDRAIEKAGTPHILVDFHAEATSEKKALGYYADGRVSAVFGTHTHVMTADARILSGGTAYLTDVGMCGAEESVLGAEIASAIDRFTSSVRRPYVAAEGKAAVSAVFTETDKNGKAIYMEAVRQ